MAHDITIDPNQTYSIGTAARLLGISASTVRNLERRGQLEAIRTPGGQRRFRGVELLRARDESINVPTKNPSIVSAATTDADAKLRHAWLGAWVARAQREVPSDTPANVRFQLVADLARALRTCGPESTGPEVELLFKSVVDHARQRAQDADEAAVRDAMKAELIDDALAHLRRRIDTLPKRLVGAPTSFERTHIRATLRDQLRDSLSRRLKGDEPWDEVRVLADEFLAEWYVKHAEGTRVPNSVKVLAAAAGFAAGAAATAALDPRIRAAVVKLKDPLRSLVLEALSRFAVPPSSPSSPSTQPDQPAPASPPPPSRPRVGAIALHPSAYVGRRKYAGIVRRPHANSSRSTPPSEQSGQSGPLNGHPVTDTPGGLPGFAT